MLKTSTAHWLILLALTAFAVVLARDGLTGNALLAPVLLLTFIKGRIVIDHFMALLPVGAPWRWIVLGWLFLVLGLIAYAFQTT